MTKYAYYFIIKLIEIGGNFQLKKIGILTFSYSENSGSVLQAWALSKAIEKYCDATTEIINYQKIGSLKPKFGVNVFFGPISSWDKKKIKQWIHRLRVFPKYIKKHWAFVKSNLTLSSHRAIKRERLVSLNNKYDYFVVGSDQVWNFYSPKVDETYFLDYVKDNTKKISYAASFGNMTYNNSNIEIAQKLLSQFSHVSLREKQGVELYQNLTGKNATFVLDPTLLHSSSTWDKLAIEPKEKNYILVYLLEPNQIVQENVTRLQEEQNLKVIRLWRSRIVDENGKDIRVISPQEWLGYIKNASIIFTNSFHGICFSINYHKCFYAVYRKNTDDSRLVNLLNVFNLSNRILVDNSAKIDDIEVNEVELEKMRSASFDYLKLALK